MSRGNNWVALDKNLQQEFKNIRREFSRIEAMFSYSLDQDKGVDLPISGYSRIWGWSRCKVRKFMKEIKTDKGHIQDRKKTVKRHPIHFIDKALWIKDDSKIDKRQVEDRQATGQRQEGHGLETHKRHIKDRLKTPTNNPSIYTVNLKKFTGDFISHIKKTTPTKSPNSKNIYEKSLDTLEKLTRLDKFEEDYIFKVIRWAAKDDFWSNQVYSLAGLRKKNKSGLTKFQNLSISYDKEQPEEDKPKIPAFRVAEEDRC